MKILELIKGRIDNFKNLCQDHKVKYLYAFGSSITENFNEDTSDIDLIVEIDEPDPIEKGEKLISLWNNFESFFQRKVDMLTETSIKNPFLKREINSKKLLIYDGSSKKIFI